MWQLSAIRAIKSGVNNFFRNGSLSITASGVMTLTLFVISFLFFLIYASNQVLEDIQNKIGINVYFKTDISEERIKEIKQELENLEDVEEIKYTSKEEALENFKERSKNNDVIMSSLDELSENPLEDSLSIKAKDSNRYVNIENEILTGDYMAEISKIDYSEHKNEIDNLNKIIASTKKGGFIMGGILIIISMLVTLNSIRLTIYTYKNEIEIMKLVGASNWFIRLPFLTEGVLYGVFGSLFVIIIWYPLSLFLSPSFLDAGISVSPLTFLNQTIIFFLPFQILLGAILGAISSYISIRRYLNL
jgi:cell division transport system permease protein